MEKYARQAIAEGLKSAEDIRVSSDTELYRVLNLHYNRNNQIDVSSTWHGKVHFGMVHALLLGAWSFSCGCRSYSQRILQEHINRKRFGKFLEETNLQGHRSPWPTRARIFQKSQLDGTISRQLSCWTFDNAEYYSSGKVYKLFYFQCYAMLPTVLLIKN